MDAVLEHSLRYRAPSEIDVDAREVRLATDAGAAETALFDGFVASPDQTAAALLVVAAVARTRYWSPPGMVAAAIRAADPVITAGDDVLRFESFSPCCGVSARLDLLPDVLDAPVISAGCTNVDFNPTMRVALARIRGSEPMRLSIGRDVTVRTLDTEVTERKVPLPSRWVRGFGESQSAAARMRTVFTVPPHALRALFRELPRISTARATPTFAAPVGRALQVTSRRDGVPLAGPQRLRVLEPLLRYAHRVHADAAPDLQGGSVWRVDLHGARFTLDLSADLGRGWSGEGELLQDLAVRTLDPGLVTRIEAALRDGGPAAGHELAESAGPEARSALASLAARGRIGWDGDAESYFHRPLPFESAVDQSEPPRLVRARGFLESGAVSTDPNDPDEVRVRSDGHEYVVRLGVADGCTCAWFGRHRGERGPCAHVLAARMAVGRR